MNSLRLNIPSDKIKENPTCHLVPCKVNYNGSTNVSDYFTPYIREEENHLTCSLRGHPLKGQKIKIPKGYIGVVLKDNEKMSLSDSNKDFKKVATFKEFTAWNWDVLPTSEDKLVKAFQWINIASALHKPVSKCTDSKKEKSQVKRKLNDVD
ncbi:uncharacterized protein CDAR_454471 [Caerostris darwini]|uniref:Uncharacterized protein n=1 Tax=Caerostris darwini TaxID=1538125 RepID=A0AAV4V7X6_9ARAC|nr:uncharacterized protein CDAR_454471 [Caerostris darwini]